MSIVVLDAMGVIYEAADDVAELLCPFIREKGGEPDGGRIKALYTEASLGRMASRCFWEAVGLDPSLEDEYLRLHALRRGLKTFLRAAKRRGYGLWCLSNDVSEWSLKLRTMHGLGGLFDGLIISGDVGLRKPDPAVYHLLMDSVNCLATDIVFVDDREKNIEAAAALGMSAVLFGPLAAAEAVSGCPAVRSFAGLSRLLLETGRA